MFVADKLVYLELQKTGGTHLLRLLERYTDGRSVGKHNRISAEFRDRFIVGSIRNPWDWYVSLWAYGTGGRGAVRARTSRRIDFDYYHRLLPKAMGKNWLTPREFATSLYHDAIKPVARWRRSYRDSSRPELFREWLVLLLDPARRYDIGEGYGFSPLSEHAGLLTYRYFRLFTPGDSVFTDQRLYAPAGLSVFDREYNILSGMIRTESLEEDFIRVLGEAGYELSNEQIGEIRVRAGDKTNVSSRQPAGFYYDAATIDLVAGRERYLIDKYGYESPSLAG